MQSRNLILIILTMLLLGVGCKKQPSAVNLEQAHNKHGQKIMAPGLGTIGVIHESQLFVYYLNESHKWILDKVSQFEIPEKNEGILALGMGFLGVVQDKVMHFYYLDAENNWVRDNEVVFVMPSKYERISTMRIPWDIGYITVENPKGVLQFYYLSEDARWVKDETVQFVLPQPLDDYMLLGGMEIAVIKDNKLGVYQLTDDAQWHFADDLVLSLPEDSKAVIAFEPGTIAVLVEDNTTLRFFDLDFMDKRWVMDPGMDFSIPRF